MNELTLTLSLSIPEANTILQALQELPAKIANPLSEKIKEQAEPQVQEFQKAMQQQAEETTTETPEVATEALEVAPQ